MEQLLDVMEPTALEQELNLLYQNNCMPSWLQWNK